MSISSLASHYPSSLRNEIAHRFPSVILDRIRFNNHFLVYQPVIPPIMHTRRGFLTGQNNRIYSRTPRRWRIGVLLSAEAVGKVQNEAHGELSFDAFLSAAEIFCIVPPSIFSIGYLFGIAIPSVSKMLQCSFGSKFYFWQFFFLVSTVAIGGLIRRRQWRRICGHNDRSAGVDLIARIEKVELDVRTSATIVRALSRQLEKLGIRFRVTRKSLKKPITEISVSEKKNLEAIDALARQESILEKELIEIQKVLLAMQEQQHKQLDLILAMAKATELLRSKQLSQRSLRPSIEV